MSAMMFYNTRSMLNVGATLLKVIPGVFTKRKTRATIRRAEPSVPRTPRVVRIITGVLFLKSSPPRRSGRSHCASRGARRLGAPSLRRFSAVILFAEVRLADARIAQERARLAADGDHAALQHVAAVAHLERETGILLDQEEGNPFRGDRPDHLEDLLDHEGCQAHARLVEQEELWPPHEV